MEILGQVIETDAQGYIQTPEVWTEEIAEEIAMIEGITLSPRHFEILHYLREQYFDNVPLSIRRIGRGGVVSIKELYALFPDGPLKKSSKIAGIPKPASCV